MYDAEPGQSRATALKAKNNSLEGRVASMTELFWQLQSCSAIKADELFNIIRSGADISAVLDTYNKENGSPDDAELDDAYRQQSGRDRTESGLARPSLHGAGLATGTGHIHRQQTGDSNAASQTISHYPSIGPKRQGTSPPSFGESASQGPLQDGCPRVDSAHGSSGASSIMPEIGTMSSSFPPVSTIAKLSSALSFVLSNRSAMEQGIMHFQSRCGRLFYICTPEQAHLLFTRVFDSDPAAVKSAVLSELCSVAAAGLLYGSDEAFADTADALYGIAKQFLDDLIDTDALRAVRTCAVLAMYNIVNKATVALAMVGTTFLHVTACPMLPLTQLVAHLLTWLELGLCLAQNNGLPHDVPMSLLTPTELIDYQKLWRTLVACKGYTSTTMQLPTCH